MAFWKLRKLRKGKVITITEGGHQYRFKVTVKKQFKRTGKPLPKRYFNTVGQHRLVLVTCTDKVVYRNGHFHYAKNLVVVAKPIK